MIDSVFTGGRGSCRAVKAGDHTGSPLRLIASALVICLIGSARPVAAFEPMPPVMTTLLKVFPERNGWFIDEPFGAPASTPADARPLFTTFRVIVPDIDSVDKAVARLLAAAPDLPVKKINRFDRKPDNAPLVGFRGIWCETENDVGFSILTPNQNRYLIWAKYAYIPALDSAGIVPKVRDAYARDVSRYLAGIDTKVPENSPPEASGRALPEWIDLYTPTPVPPMNASEHLESKAAAVEEITLWGMEGVAAFVPTQNTVKRIIDETRDTLWANVQIRQIQQEFREYGEVAYFRIRAFEPADIVHNHGYPPSDFALDRYGRMRTSISIHEGSDAMPMSLFFPAAPVLSTGSFKIVVPGQEYQAQWVQEGPARLEALMTGCSPYFWAFPQSVEMPLDSVTLITDEHLRTLGHILRILRDQGINLDNVWIRKFGVIW